MLSKPTGGSLLYTLSTSTGTATVSTWTGDVPRKVRVAVSGYAAVINFYNNKTANNNSDILMPPGTVEHFNLENTTTATFVVVSGAGGTGWISFTPVA